MGVLLMILSPSIFLSPGWARFQNYQDFGNIVKYQQESLEVVIVSSNIKNIQTFQLDNNFPSKKVKFLRTLTTVIAFFGND